MDLYSMSDKAILAEIAKRVKSLRLRRNMTQDQLSHATTLSLTAIKSIETGGGKLITLIPVLRELGALDALENFIPEVTISPLQLARRKGKTRERASGLKNKKAADKEVKNKW